MIISKRLETIVDIIQPCKTLADIGCDHGIVSIQSIQKGKAKHVIAADVAEGPLAAAKRNITAEGTAANTEFLLSDGLRQFPDNVDLECVVIAGMGGMLIKSILEAAKLTRFPNLKQLVLGPQSDIDEVRHFLIDKLNYKIKTETYIYDDGKYYSIFDVDTTISEAESYTGTDYMFGRTIAPSSKDTYQNFLKHRYTILCTARDSAKKGSGEKALKKLSELEKDIALVETALAKEGVHYDR